MRALKKLDYFRKTDQKYKTRTGGIISILSVLVSFLMLMTWVVDRVPDLQPILRLQKASHQKGLVCRS
jgi:hypothetical protein